MQSWLNSLIDSERVKRFEFIRDNIEMFCTKVRETVPMKDFKKAYEKYQKDMDKGKMVVIMSDVAGVGVDDKKWIYATGTDIWTRWLYILVLSLHDCK